MLNLILTASRLPAALGLDIRAFIATLNVARDRVGALTERYGSDKLAESMARMVAGSEARLRHRLTELPDARIRAWDFLEHDGHQNRLYKVDVVIDKRGDSLRLDFSGSSEQAPGFINCTRAGLHGGVMGALLPTLAFDIPWNEGLMAVAEIVAPDGLVCTARHPAPVGAATVEAVWVVCNAVASALNKLLGCSPRYLHRAQAVSAGAMATFNMGGRNQFGEWFGLHLMDPLAAGMGPSRVRTASTPVARSRVRCPLSQMSSTTNAWHRCCTSTAAWRPTAEVRAPIEAAWAARPRSRSPGSTRSMRWS